MRIGIVISAFTNGGAQRVAMTLSKWLSDYGHNCCIIALGESAKNQYDAHDVNLIRLRDVYKEQSITNRLRKFDCDNQIDVYVVMGVPMCMYVIPALRKSRAKVIVSERNDPKNFQGKTLTKIVSRWLMSKADGFVFQTSDAWSFYKKYQNRSTIIPNPVAEVPEVLNRTQNEFRKKEIVTAGRLIPQKNHEMLIRTFAKISSSFPEYRLVIYGEGLLKDFLRELCRDLGVEQKVSFPGSVNDVHKRIIDSELFVLSSNFEGMPNALMEAMAMGITCISTDCPCGGPKDLVENGENGVLIPVGNVDACAKAIAKCLTEKQMSDELGKNALEVRKKYSKDIICKKWLDYVEKIVG